MPAEPAWRELLVAALDQRGLDGLAALAVAAFEQEFELVREDPDLRGLAHRSTVANLELVADLVRGELTLAEFEPPPAAVAFVRELARRNVSVAELAMAYRVSQRVAWRAGVATLRRGLSDPTDIAACIEAYTDATFASGEVLMALALERYAQERERWVRSAGVVRRATLDDILARRVGDVDAASLRLGYELRRTHVGFVLWADADDAVLETAAVAVGGQSALVVGLEAGVVAGWTAAGVDLDAAAGARVALGLPGSGADGFRESHLQALEARRAARLIGSPEEVVRYADYALVSLLTHDFGRACAFARRELGPLAEPEHGRLADTVRQVLLAHGSPRRAALELGLHENTVAKRVRAAEQLLGRSILERPAETVAALLVLPACAGD